MVRGKKKELNYISSFICFVQESVLIRGISKLLHLLLNSICSGFKGQRDDTGRAEGGQAKLLKLRKTAS